MLQRLSVGTCENDARAVSYAAWGNPKERGGSRFDQNTLACITVCFPHVIRVIRVLTRLVSTVYRVTRGNWRTICIYVVRDVHAWALSLSQPHSTYIRVFRVDIIYHITTVNCSGVWLLLVTTGYLDIHAFNVVSFTAIRDAFIVLSFFVSSLKIV